MNLYDIIIFKWPVTYVTEPCMKKTRRQIESLQKVYSSQQLQEGLQPKVCSPQALPSEGIMQ